MKVARPTPAQFRLEKQPMKITPPTPFCIVRDTREQNPLQFPDGTPVITATCYPGDYSLVGYRTKIAIERKGVALNNGVYTSDLVGTITELLRGQSGDFERGSIRFRYELMAMSRIIRAGGVAFVATDRPRSWYARHDYFGGLHPSALFGTIRSLTAEYGVPFLFFESSQDLANYALGISLEVWKHANGLKSYRMNDGDHVSTAYAKWMREIGVSL